MLSEALKGRRGAAPLLAGLLSAEQNDWIVFPSTKDNFCQPDANEGAILTPCAQLPIKPDCLRMFLRPGVSSLFTPAASFSLQMRNASLINRVGTRAAPPTPHINIWRSCADHQGGPQQAKARCQRLHALLPGKVWRAKESMYSPPGSSSLIWPNAPS